MKKSMEILGLSIISIGEGKELGTAKDMVIDAAKGEVAAIVVEDGKWYLGAKILPFNMIQGIGEYALTIENSSTVVPLASLEGIISLLEADVRVKGTKVLTKDGKMQGEVTELLIDEQSGKIAGCEIKLVNGDADNISAEQVITFGKDVLVIREEGANTVSPPTVTPKITISTPQPHTVTSYQTVAPVQSAKSENTPDMEPVDAAGETGNEIQGKEDLSKKFDEKHRKFILGKKSTRRIEADNGELIIDQDAEITDEVIQQAKNAGKFVELTMSIAP